MAKDKKRFPPQDTMFGEDVTYAPRDTSPKVKMHWVAKFARVGIVFVLITAPLVMFAGFISFAKGNPEIPPALATSPGRVAAEDALLSWLDRDPSPLPNAQVIAWEGYRDISSEVMEPNSDNPYTVTYEANDFVVGVPAVTNAEQSTTTEKADTDAEKAIRDALPTWKATYRATVVVAVDSRGGGVVVTTPSLVPIAEPPANLSPVDIVTPKGWSSAVTNENIKKSIQRWADAYASGDAEELRLAVGDGSETNTYTPMTGLTSLTADVGNAISNDNGKSMVVRVELAPLWDGQKATDEDAPATFSMDVLVAQANTGAPVVVAWGPAGEGTSLVKFGNALPGPRADITTTAEDTTPDSTTTTAADDSEDEKSSKSTTTTTAADDIEQESPPEDVTTTTKVAPTTTAAPTTTGGT
jgi:hypothetical protein